MVKGIAVDDSDRIGIAIIVGHRRDVECSRSIVTVHVTCHRHRDVIVIDRVFQVTVGEVLGVQHGCAKGECHQHQSCF